MRERKPGKPAEPASVSRLVATVRTVPHPTPEDPSSLTSGVPLAQLIKRRLIDAPELIMLGSARSVVAEKFRRLKTMLAHQAGGGHQVIVVTSPAPSEGKSVISTNLALAFAADKLGEVLLLDADLRRPTIEKWLTPAPKLGLSELLRGKIEVDHAVLSLENSPLKILPAGSPPPDPVELLSSDYARVLMSTLRRRYKRIIIDTPPIIPFTDADVLGSMSDGMLVVARAGSTLRSTIRQAIGLITSTQVLGTVLNDTTSSLADRESQHLDKNYYRYYEQDRKP